MATSGKIQDAASAALTAIEEALDIGAPPNAAGRGLSVMGWVAGLPAAVWATLGLAAGALLRRFLVEFQRSRSVRWLLDL
jgi:hypothetical protein